MVFSKSNMNRVVIMCSSAIITGIYAIDLYREYRNKEYIDKIDKLEKDCEYLKKELESALVVKHVLEETAEAVNINELDLDIDIQDSEPSPYGSCEEEGDDNENGDNNTDENNTDENNTDEVLLNSESDTSVEELSVSNVIEDNEESTESTE